MINKSDMSDFYCNLLKSNVVFGVRNVLKFKEIYLGVEKGVECLGLEL